MSLNKQTLSILNSLSNKVRVAERVDGYTIYSVPTATKLCTISHDTIREIGYECLYATLVKTIISRTSDEMQHVSLQHIVCSPDNVSITEIVSRPDFIKNKLIKITITIPYFSFNGTPRNKKKFAQFDYTLQLNHPVSLGKINDEDLDYIASAIETLFAYIVSQIRKSASGCDLPNALQERIKSLTSVCKYEHLPKPSTPTKEWVAVKVDKLLSK